MNNALKQATTNNESFGYTDEEIVSSDIIGSHFGSVFDATQTEITAVGDLQLVKTVAWYDNEYGFVTQLIRTLENSLNSDAHRRRKKPPPLSLIKTVNKPPGSADIHASHVYHLRRQYRIYAIRRGSLA
ncbi:hypothetical protein OIU82_23195 [Escherichia coli]|nr:hypothetical protein [Escherichia coli]